MESGTLEDIQKEYSHLSSLYFNSAYFGPSPLSAKKLIEEAMQKELDPSFYLYHDWMGISERLRIKFSELLKVSPDRISHQTSSSDVVNIVANGYRFSPGDRVAAIDRDYPSNILPWMLLEKNKGVAFDRLELGDEVIPTAKWLEKKLHPQTRIFSISWVTFDTGKKIDLIEIGKFLKSRGILFIVDGTQGLGGLELSTQELSYIDVFTCSSYKWMLGPYGHAFFYISEAAEKMIHHDRANWILSPKSKEVYNLLDYTTETLPGARKYDRGQAANLLVSACMEGSLNFFKKIGLQNIQQYNQNLTQTFLENYPQKKFQLITPVEYRGNIICLKATGLDSIELEHALKSRNVDVSVRQGNVRISFHVFNTESQVFKLIQALDF